MIAKVLHIILAGIIFISSSGITVNSHYCLDELKEIALFVPAKQCCAPSPKLVTDQKSEQSPHVSNKDCCENMSRYAQADFDSSQGDDRLLISKTIPLLATLATTSLANYSNNFYHFFSKDEVRHFNFRPPPPTRKIYLIIESFLC